MTEMLKHAASPGTLASRDQPIVSIDKGSRSFDFKKASLFRKAKSFRAVDEASLDLIHGETLAVVGESGCGKSTLGRLMAGLMRPSGGSVLFEGTDFAELSAEDWRNSRKSVQVIFQDAAGSLDPRLPVSLQVREPLDLHRLGTQADRKARTADMLEAVKLGRHLWDAVPSELSGGQQQRIVIARALILQPDLLICDEPVSALDVSIQAQVLALLTGLRDRMGLTVLFISHDLSVVRQVADRIAVMYLGQIVECGQAEQVFTAPHHPYTMALLSAVPIPDPAVPRPRHLLIGDPPSPHAPPSGCRFHTRCPKAKPLCAQTEPAPQRLNGCEVLCHFPEVRP